MIHVTVKKIYPRVHGFFELGVYFEGETSEGCEGFRRWTSF